MSIMTPPWRYPPSSIQVLCKLLHYSNDLCLLNDPWSNGVFETQTLVNKWDNTRETCVSYDIHKAER